jgi:hypothetical protein
MTSPARIGGDELAMRGSGTFRLNHHPVKEVPNENVSDVDRRGGIVPDAREL